MNKKSHLTLYYITMVAIGLITGCMGPSLGQLAMQTHGDLKSVSLVLALRPAGYMFGALLSGRLFDRVPGHPILAAALLLSGALMVFVPWIPNLNLLVAVILVLGLADGVMDVGVNTLLGWVFGAEVGPYMNGLHFIFAIGALTAPILIAQSLRFGSGISLAFAVMGLSMLPIALFVLRMPSPAHAKIPETQVKIPQAKVSKVLAAQLLALFFLYGGSEASFGGWISSYATALHMTDVAGAAYVSSLFWASLALGRLISIPLSLRLDLRWILGVDIAGMLFSLGSMLLFPQSHVALWVGSAGSGFFMSSFFPTLLAYAGRRLSPEGRISGFMVSLFFICSSTSSVVLPWMIGQKFESWGPWVAIAGIFAFSLGLAAIFFRLIWAESNQRPAI